MTKQEAKAANKAIQAMHTAEDVLSKNGHERAAAAMRIAIEMAIDAVMEEGHEITGA